MTADGDDDCDDCAEMIMIDGAPGSGKTYELQQQLRNERDEHGVGLDDFLWINFSRSAREDVIDEIGELYEPTETATPCDRARTLHSVCYELAREHGILSIDYEGDGGDKVIVQDDPQPGEIDPYADFCRRLGIRYDRRHNDPRRLLSGDWKRTPTGNRLFSINSYLTATCKEPEQWWHAGIDVDIRNTNRVADLLRKWAEYKADPPDEITPDGRLFEHGDYVDEVFERGLVPDCDILLIDEFQDFAPQEYRIVKLWRDSGQIRRIYAAGDPNQAIYQFRGATPYYFEQTIEQDKADEVITCKESRRCPERIASFANAILSAHPATDPRGFRGRDAGGTVRWRPLDDQYLLRDEILQAIDDTDEQPAVKLLTRTNQQRFELLQDLHDVGLPYHLLGGNSSIWRDDLTDILSTLALLGQERDLGDIPRKGLHDLLDNLRIDRDGIYDQIDRDGRAPDLVDRTAVVGGTRVTVNAREIIERVDDALAEDDEDDEGDVDAGDVDEGVVLEVLSPDEVDALIAEHCDPKPRRVERIDDALREHQSTRVLSWTEPVDEINTMAIDAAGIDIRQVKEVEPVFADYDGLRDITQSLNIKDWKRNVLANAIDAPAGVSADDIAVGTIHSAKGLEAPCVYLFADSTQTIVDRCADDPDAAAEEHRAYYVGASRASEALHIIEGYFGGPTAPPLDAVRDSGQWVATGPADKDVSAEGGDANV